MLERAAGVVIAIVLAAACGGHPAPPPKEPDVKTVSIVDAEASEPAPPRTGSPSQRVEQGMVQTGCSNGIYDSAAAGTTYASAVGTCTGAFVRATPPTATSWT